MTLHRGGSLIIAKNFDQRLYGTMKVGGSCLIQGSGAQAAKRWNDRACDGTNATKENEIQDGEVERKWQPYLDMIPDLDKKGDFGTKVENFEGRKGNYKMSGGWGPDALNPEQPDWPNISTHIFRTWSLLSDGHTLHSLFTALSSFTVPIAYIAEVTWPRRFFNILEAATGRRQCTAPAAVCFLSRDFFPLSVPGTTVAECSLLGPHHCEPGSIPVRVTGFSQVGIVPDDGVNRRVFPEISPLPPFFIPAHLYTHLNHPHRLSRARCLEPPKSLHSFDTRRPPGLAPNPWYFAGRRQPAPTSQIWRFSDAEDASRDFYSFLNILWGRSGSAVRLLASHKGEPQVQSPDGSLPIFVSGHRAGRYRCSAGFLGDLLFPPPLRSGAAPFSPHLTFIGSQDLVVKSRPNISTLISTLRNFNEHQI
ncbi:hypothetical protein PR048_019796 [Dryococelus australis]|uniref:Uncharacterized protein n=1 Tax=Dryococelus australis TaxID=614101 RepID=A0ABQ9H4L2_9NEOP|nr:hypothetical protein PR048_019796 [Dryococelus australis]